MFEIGSSLRQARQHRGLALTDVERETRIRARYLGALEDERFDVLPGDAYVRGFLRTYADYLGLDGSVFVAEFNERRPPDDDLPAIRHEPVGGMRAPRIARPLLGSLVAVAGATVVVWQLGFTPPPKHHTVAPPAVTITPAATTTAKPKPPPAPKAAPATLVITAARGDCWVSVRFGSANGTVLVERTLQQGGTLRFGLARPLWVRLGAPANVDVTERGQQLGPYSGSRPVNLTAR